MNTTSSTTSAKGTELLWLTCDPVIVSDDSTRTRRNIVNGFVGPNGLSRLRIRLWNSAPLGYDEYQLVRDGWRVQVVDVQERTIRSVAVIAYEYERQRSIGVVVHVQ